MFMHRCKECADRLKRSQLVFAQRSFLFKGSEKKERRKKRYYTCLWTNSFYRSGSSLVYCNSLNPSALIQKFKLWAHQRITQGFLTAIREFTLTGFPTNIKNNLRPDSSIKEVFEKKVYLLQTQSSLWRPFFLTYLGYTPVPTILVML